MVFNFNTYLESEAFINGLQPKDSEELMVLAEKKMFKEIEARVKRYGAKDPSAVAASVLWKAARKKGVGAEGRSNIVKAAKAGRDIEIRDIEKTAKGK
jgi:hypothetical protein